MDWTSLAIVLMLVVMICSVVFVAYHFLVYGPELADCYMRCFDVEACRASCDVSVQNAMDVLRSR
jgi:hypothetical protein